MEESKRGIGILDCVRFKKEFTDAVNRVSVGPGTEGVIVEVFPGGWALTYFDVEIVGSEFSTIIYSVPENYLERV